VKNYESLKKFRIFVNMLIKNFTKKKITSWRSIIYKCPHCNESVYIYHKSTIGTRPLVEGLYSLLLDHKRVCKSYKSPKVFYIKISTVDIYGAQDNYKVKLIF
jgi:hypothetical protein